MTNLLRSILALAIIAAISPYASYGAKPSAKVVRRPVAATNEVTLVGKGAQSERAPGGNQFNRVASVLTVPVPHATITAALVAAVAGDTIDVAAGVYAENVIVNKSVVIRGAGVAGTVIVPSFVGANPGGPGSLPPGHSSVFLIQANDVTIERLTVDGNNPSLTSGIVVGGVDIDARNGIITNNLLGSYPNLTVRNVMVKNIYLRGIYALGGTFAFRDSRVQNVQADPGSIGIFNFGGSGVIERDTVSDCNDAIAANHSAGTQFLNNTVSSSSSGVHTDNAGDGGGVADTIRGNTVSNSPASGYGIWVFVPFIAPIVTDNTVTNVDYGLGAFAGAFGPTVTARFVNNVIDAQNKPGSIGFYVTNTSFSFGLTNVAVNMTQNEFKNNDYGMFIESGTGFTVTMSANGNSIHDNAVMGVDSGAVPVVYGGSGGLGTLAVSLVGNWWGSITGPGHPVSNPSGTGNDIDDGLDYSPWWGADYRSIAHPWNWYVNTSNSAAVQEGVDSASAGDQVNVIAGLYEEQVEITKALTLQGAGSLTTTIKSPVTLTKFFVTSGPNNNYPIVYAHDASGVIVDGFTIDGAGRGNANYRFIGAGYRNAGGTVSNCIIKDIRNTPINGAQHGNAVYAFADNGTARTLNLRLNSVNGFQKNGMTLVGADLTSNVYGNTVTGGGPINFIAQNGIQLSFSSTGSIDSNVVSGFAYTPFTTVATGMLIFSAGGTVQTTRNTITEAMVGIYYIDAEGTIEQNTVTNTVGGMGITPYWWLIDADPGVGASRLPAVSAVDAEGALVRPAKRGTRPTAGGSGNRAMTLTTAVLRNVVDGGGNGTGIEADALGTETLNFNAEENIATNCVAGFVLYKDPTATLNSTVYNNNISGNEFGLANQTGVLQDASANWWGSATGPANTGSATGTGDSVTTDVDYTPWLNSATDTQGGTAGFQGDFSYLNVDDNSPQTGVVARVQEGVDLVSGSTVNLLPGTYEEQVEIDSNLTLIGAGASSTFIKAPITLTKFFTTPGPNNNYPVVYVHDAATVTINGITIDGAGRGNGNYRFVGVGYRNAGGLLTNCTIRDIRESPISGSQHGVAIYGYANNGIPRTLTVSLDSVYGFQKNGTVFTGADLTAQINTSTFVGAGAVSFIAQNGIQLSGGSTGSITGNTVRSLSYTPATTVSTGILLFQPAAVNVRNNTIVETQVGTYFIDIGGDFVGNNVSATLAGVGTPVFWGVIVDPGATVPRAKSSPLDAAPQTRRAGSQRGLAVLNTRVDSNTVTGDGSNGIGVEADAYSPETLILTANENVITGWEVGAVTYKDLPGATLTSTWRRNKISGNLYGMLDLTGTLQDAKQNWWGNASGPADVKSLPNTPNYNNLPGTGDSVSVFVDYLPWYVDSLLTTLSVPAYLAAPTNISFGSILVGNSKVDSALVTNVGAFPLVINSAISDNVAQFGVAASGPDTLNPTVGKWYHVTFHPTTAGFKSGNMIFSHTASTSPDTVTLNGAGGKLFLSIPPDTMIGLNSGGHFQRAARRGHGAPNWVNLLSEVVVQGGFQPGSVASDSAGGMRVALSFMQKVSGGRWKPIPDSANIHGWVRLTKWNVARNKGLNFNYLQTTLYDHSGKHTGPAHGFDLIVTGQQARAFRKERVSLRPRQSSNKLFAEVVAAKFNIAASLLGKIPTGFGDLVLAIPGNPYDGMSIIDIVAKADTALTYWQGRPQVEYDSLHATLRRVNRAFVGQLDTVSYIVGNNLVLKGVIEVADIPFLTWGPAPPHILPRTTNETEDEGEFGSDSFDDEDSPVATKLYQNYPNPFNPTTTISFRLKETSVVTLKVYNVLGQESQVLLNNEEMDEGYQTVEFSAGNFASGVYFYRISAQSIEDASLSTSEVRKMVLVK